MASTLVHAPGRRTAENDTNTIWFGDDALGRLRFVTYPLGKLAERRYNSPLRARACARDTVFSPLPKWRSLGLSLCFKMPLLPSV